MHVGKVNLVRPGDDAFGHGMAAGYHEVVTRQIDLLHGEHQQGQVLGVVLLDARQVLREGGCRVPSSELLAVTVRKEIDRPVQARVRVDPKQSPDDSFVAGKAHQPVMDDGDLSCGAGTHSSPCDARQWPVRSESPGAMACAAGVYCASSGWR